MKNNDALSQLSLEIEKNPTNADLLVNRGNYFFTQSNFASALADFNKAYRLGKRDNDFLVVYAETFSNLDEDEKALQFFDEVLSNLDMSLDFDEIINPDKEKMAYELNVRALRGMSCQKLKRYYDAVSEFSCCIEFEPVNANYYFDRAGVYSDMERYEEAVSDLTCALKLEPDNPTFLTHRALAYWNINSNEEALKDLDTVIKNGKGSTLEYYIHGCILQRLERYLEAIEDYDKALKDMPNDVDALFARGVAYAAVDNEKQALKDMTMAVEISPENPYFAFHLGMLYAKMKDFPKAILQFNKTLALDPKNVQQLGETYEERGLAYYGMGDFREAILDFHKSVMLSKGRVKNLIDYQTKTAVEIKQQMDMDIYEDDLIPYWFMVREIEDNPSKTIMEIVGVEEINNIAAAFVAFEKYDLLKRYVAEGLSLNVHTDLWAFRTWQPTPFYFALCRAIRVNIKDLDRLLTLLVSLGADPDMSAADDSTPLWNTCHPDVPFHCLELLLTLGADPNKRSFSEDCFYSPLSVCLLSSESEDGNQPLPPNAENMAKARLLLEKGANPNLGIDDIPPLLQAIITCDHKYIDFIEFMINKGADVNAFGQEQTLTPLLLTYDNDWFEAGQILILHGANVETMKNLLEMRHTAHIVGLKATVDTYFRPGSGADSKDSHTFSFEQVSKNTVLNYQYYYISILEIDRWHIKGEVTWRESDYEQKMRFNFGSFELTLEHPVFRTKYLNCAYDTQMSLILELEFSKVDDDITD